MEVNLEKSDVLCWGALLILLGLSILAWYYLSLSNAYWRSNVSIHYQNYYENFVYNEYSARVYAFEYMESVDQYYLELLSDDGQITLHLCQNESVKADDSARVAFYSLKIGDSVKKDFGDERLSVKRDGVWFSVRPDFCKSSYW